MKAKIVLLLCFLSFFSNAQEIQKFNAGFDFLLFKVSYENGYGTVNYSSRGGAFVEKAIQLSFLKQTFLSPGLAYKSINEKYSGGGLGGGSASKLNHYALSGYLKIIHKTELFKSAGFYYGALGGANFITWARGNASSYSLQYEQANWENPNYKEDPSHLFHKMYAGILTGVQFSEKTSIKTSLELRLLPRLGEYKEQVLSPFEFVLNLGFGGNVQNKKDKN